MIVVFSCRLLIPKNNIFSNIYQDKKKEEKDALYSLYINLKDEKKVKLR